MKTIKALVLLVFAASLFVACGSEQTAEEKAKEQLNEGVDKISDGINDMTKGVEGGLADALNKLEDAVDDISENVGEANKKPINFRKLKEVLPEKNDGFTRTKAGGETNSIGGFGVSKAEAKYEKDDMKMDVELIDMGSAGGALAGFASWAMVDIDKENDDGFERTTTFKGNKAYEKCRKGRCEFAIFVGNRFMLTTKGRNVEIDDLHDLVNSFDIKKLESMKDEEG